MLGQVFESYGNKSNYEYLLYNGFVMQDNPNDCVYVTFSGDNEFVTMSSAHPSDPASNL